jgi:hypothetical protein
VVILKSVLSAILVYFILFFKAPTGIISKLESLFKQFILGGSEDDIKINWIKCNKVCRLLDEGGGYKKFKG